MRRQVPIGVITPSVRHIIVRHIRQMVLSREIVLVPADDDMLWCILNLRQPTDTLQDAYHQVTALWGPPVRMSVGVEEAVFLFNLLEGRVRDCAN